MVSFTLQSLHVWINSSQYCWTSTPKMYFRNEEDKIRGREL
jgi:hypothetical protein